jgi:hypothetical protein
MRRLIVLLVASVVVLLANTSVASADWNPVARRPGGVQVEVHQAGGPGAYSEAGGSSGIACQYKPYPKLPGFVPPSIPIGTPDPHAGEPGTWYASICTDGTEMWLGDLWVPAAQPAVAPAVLAQLARRYIPLPPPGIHLNPPVGADHFVNLDSWLWVDPATWGQRTATASVPNESATVAATPISVTWTMGDGGQVTCQGPGVAYDTTRPPEGQRTNCSYTYRRSSAGRPGERYSVTATTTWAISWTATGAAAASGTLPPLLRTATTTVRVAEAQAIN